MRTAIDLLLILFVAFGGNTTRDDVSRILRFVTTVLAVIAVPFCLIIAFCFIVTQSGCARMGTRQGDKSTTTTVYELNDKGRTNSITVTETRETQTRASGTALISSSSSFEGLDASQDGKKQGLKLKKSEQKSDIDKMMDLMDRVTQGAARMYGVQVPPAAPAIPDGFKIVPKDDPSKPRKEVE